MKPFMPLLRNMLLVALLALSASSMAQLTADFCWKDTSTRGVGTIPTGCPAVKENQAGLCYPQCKGGMTGVGPVCWSSCPAGYIDMGAICHIDKPLLKEGSWECTDRGLFGECWWGKMNCSAGYTNIGLLCALTAVPTPDGFSGTYLDPMKNTYGRGAGTIPTGCATGEEYDAGLCYKTCPAGYSGAGPVCWGQAPIGWVNCGMGAASNSDNCAATVVSEVAAVGNMAINIATYGATSGLPVLDAIAKLKDAYAKAKNANRAWALAAQGSLFLDNPVSDRVCANTAGCTVRTILDTDNNVLGPMSEADLITVAQSVASVVSIKDPTGATGVVKSFAYPLCANIGPLQPQPPPKPAPVEPPAPPMRQCYCSNGTRDTGPLKSIDERGRHCEKWADGDLPGLTCRYTAELERFFSKDPYPPTCGQNNPLCGGPEKAINGCLETYCKPRPPPIK